MTSPLISGLGPPRPGWLLCVSVLIARSAREKADFVSQVALMRRTQGNALPRSPPRPAPVCQWLDNGQTKEVVTVKATEGTLSTECNEYEYSVVGTKFQNENIILLFYINISLFFHWALSLVAFHVLFISSLGTVVLKILITFQFFAVEKTLGKLF